MFLTKADLPLPDQLLRGLRTLDPLVDGLTPEVAAGAAARATGCAIAGVEPSPAAGTFHQVYMARLKGSETQVVVRLGRLWREGTDWGMHADAMATRAAAAHGVPCAKTLAVDTSRRESPVDTQVLEQAPGQCLRELDADDAAIAPHLAALARTLRQIHGIQGEGFGFLDIRAGLGEKLRGIHTSWSHHVLNRVAEHVNVCHAAGLVTVGEGAMIRGIFAGSKDWLDASSSQLLHGDCGNHNVFTGDGHGPVLIDWEDALLGDPAYDLAMWATFHPERRWAAFFEAYGADWDHPRFWVHFLRIALAKTVHRLRFGYTDAPGRAPASIRIQRALAAMRELDRV